MHVGPDIVCIGAQKCGTTWLDNVLRSRGDVFLPPVKEIHYFSQLYTEPRGKFGAAHRLQQAKALTTYYEAPVHPLYPTWPLDEIIDHLSQETVDDEWYLRIFEKADRNMTKIEICPTYLYIDRDGVEHVKRLNSDLKIIVIIRDPVERAISHVKMQTHRGVDERSMSDLVHEDQKLFQYLDYTDYKKYFPVWRSLFKKQNILVVNYRTLEENPLQFLTNVFEFCDLDPSQFDRSFLGRHVFEGPKVPVPPKLVERLRRELEPQYAYLRDELGLLFEQPQAL